MSVEEALWATGYRAIAGVDEAGRGAWAGPVVAAAVILPPDPVALAPLLGQVNDSKRLSPVVRARVFDLVCQHALAVGVGRVEASVIDRIGILPATQQAMLDALADLSRPCDFVLLDYLTLPALDLPQRGLPHGDAISLSIAAASIIAKVTRDRWMSEFDGVYPGYGFAAHKGYGVPAHAAALARLGPCPLHRLSFRPVRAVLKPADAAAWREASQWDCVTEASLDVQEAETDAAAWREASQWDCVTEASLDVHTSRSDVAAWREASQADCVTVASLGVHTSRSDVAAWREASQADCVTEASLGVHTSRSDAAACCGTSQQDCGAFQADCVTEASLGVHTSRSDVAAWREAFQRDCGAFQADCVTEASLGVRGLEADAAAWCEASQRDCGAFQADCVTEASLGVRRVEADSAAHSSHNLAEASHGRP